MKVRSWLAVVVLGLWTGSAGLLSWGQASSGQAAGAQSPELSQFFKQYFE